MTASFADNFEVKCCQCGKTETVNNSRYPDTAHEILTICTLVDFVAAIDSKRDRALVFCSKKCRDMSKTNDGQFMAQLPMEGVA